MSTALLLLCKELDMNNCESLSLCPCCFCSCMPTLSRVYTEFEISASEQADRLLSHADVILMVNFLLTVRMRTMLTCDVIE